MTNEELVHILKKRVNKISPIFVSKFPINALSLSEKEYSKTIIDIRGKDAEDIEEPIKVVYSIDTEQFNVIEGYIKIVNFQKDKRQYIPANIWSTLEPIVNVLPDDLLFDPEPLLNFPSLKETISKKGLKRVIKEIVRQILNKEIRLEPPVDVTVKETITTHKKLQESFFTGKKWWKLDKWWINSEGKIFNVSSEFSHAEWARQYIIEIFGENHPYAKVIEKNYNPEKMYDIMYGLKWVRTFFLSHDKILYFVYQDNKPNPKVMSTLKYMAKQLNARLIDHTIDQSIAIAEEKSQSLDETMTYKELMALTTDDRKKKASDVRVRSIPVSIEEGQEQWNFRYKSSPTTTVTDKPFEGHITFLKGEVESDDDATDLDCKVDCGCPDFMYRFAYNDTQKDASVVGPDSLSGCINRRPKPAYDYGEGLCKHLAALSRYLKTKISATRRSNLFEALHDVAGQGPFNITYYDD